MLTNPIATIAGLGTGILGSYGSDKALNFVDKQLEDENKRIAPGTRGLINFGIGLGTGGFGASAMTKVPVKFSTRSMAFLHNQPIKDQILNSTYEPFRIEL
jgi:hypothetical protein